LLSRGQSLPRFCVVESTAVLLALGFAFVLGVSDAPNATAMLVGSGTAGYRAAGVLAFVTHAAGAFIGGTAVAFTIARLVDVSAGEDSSAFAAASIAAIALVAVGARLGIPVSASVGLVGGLVGAALVAGGASAVDWGGFDGIRPRGVAGILLGLAVSPLVGIGAAWLVRRGIDRLLRRASRRMLGPVRGGIWLGAAFVGLSDGTNDGQKAMGLIVGTLIATGRLDELSVPTWSRASVGVVLGLGTVIGGRRIVRTVGRGFYRGGPLDGVGAQGTAAGVIFACSGLGLPISTSTVVSSSVVGVGLDRRPRHVHWRVYGRAVLAWALTVPVCVGLGALLYLFFRAV
jgi:PiT family inorganic phosphate transporter